MLTRDRDEVRQAHFRIAVIGAGLAGLSATRDLLAAGIDVTIFEKSRGLGGRAATRRIEGFEFDHGAQFFTLREPRLQAALTQWLSDKAVARWAPRQHGSTAANPEPIYVGSPGMSALGGYLAAGSKPMLSTRILAARFDGLAWQLEDERGGAHGPFAALIVAVPAPQALALLGDANPLGDALAGIDYAPCWALMAAFDAPLPAGFDTASVVGAPLAWIARNSSKPGRAGGEAWVLHADGDWSRDQLEAAPEDVERDLWRSFGDTLGFAPPQPVQLALHRWRYAKVSRAAGIPCLSDAAQRLIYCGDGCLGPRVEAALMSGLAAADVARGYLQA